jgi:hypothetical protein
MKSLLFRSLPVAVFLSFSFSMLSAQTWTMLGSRKVHGHADHDEIAVTSSRGDFKAIKLFVENEGIDFDRLVVHYGNGSAERMEIKNFIPAGGETRVMDLAGGDRVIKKVVFYYKSNPNTSAKGKVVLYGKR